jgi:hypothetical protein
MIDKLLLLFFALFNLYLLWRVDKIEKERPSYHDIKNIFELLVEKVTRNENDTSI